MLKKILTLLFFGFATMTFAQIPGGSFDQQPGPCLPTEGGGFGCSLSFHGPKLEQQVPGGPEDGPIVDLPPVQIPVSPGPVMDENMFLRGVPASTFTGFAFRVGLPAFSNWLVNRMGEIAGTAGGLLPQNYLPHDIPCAFGCAMGGPNGGDIGALRSGNGGKKDPFYNVVGSKATFKVSEAPSFRGQGFRRYLVSKPGTFEDRTSPMFGKPRTSFYQEALDGRGMWRTSDHWGVMPNGVWNLEGDLEALGGKEITPGFWYFEKPVTGFVKYEDMIFPDGTNPFNHVK